MVMVENHRSEIGKRAARVMLNKTK